MSSLELNTHLLNFLAILPLFGLFFPHFQEESA